LSPKQIVVLDVKQLFAGKGSACFSRADIYEKSTDFDNIFTDIYDEAFQFYPWLIQNVCAHILFSLWAGNLRAGV